MKDYENIEIEIIEFQSTEIVTDSTYNNPEGGQSGGSSDEGFDI